MFAEMMRLLGIGSLPIPEVASGGEGVLLEEVRTLAANRRPASQVPPARPRVPSGPAARAPLVESCRVILIGASTGGVEALHRVLAEFPADCPPTLVVQHIRGAFSAAFADRLNRACSAEVAEARDGQALRQGLILVAPGDATHLELRGPTPVQCRLAEAPPMSGHRPSVDALFRSAVPLRDRAVGVLLTGMGQDGARGLLQIREAGGHTIAQDRETSTVYGMPRVAAELGSAVEILSLGAIARATLAAAARRSGRIEPLHQEGRAPS
jgi:two-component system chemotaxis response regulator CheB